VLSGAIHFVWSCLNGSGLDGRQSMKRSVGWRDDICSEHSWEIPLVLLGLLMIRSSYFLVGLDELKVYEDGELVRGF